MQTHTHKMTKPQIWTFTIYHIPYKLTYTELYYLKVNRGLSIVSIFSLFSDHVALENVWNNLMYLLEL